MNFINILTSIIICIITFVIGVFCWCQIVGSFAAAITRMQKFKKSLFPIILWLVVLSGITILVHLFLSSYLVAYYIGIGASFIKSLLSIPSLLSETNEK